MSRTNVIPMNIQITFLVILSIVSILMSTLTQLRDGGLGMVLGVIGLIVVTLTYYRECKTTVSTSEPAEPNDRGEAGREKKGGT